MKKLAPILSLLFPFLLLLFPFIAKGELDRSNIVAIVNDTPITKYEFQERKKLAVKMFNIDLTQPGVDAQVNRDIMKALIETEILKQHAEKIGGRVTDNDIEDTITLLEQQNQMPKGGMRAYLKANNIKFETFKEQLISERIKMNIMQSMNSNQSVSQSEIETAIIYNSDKDFEVEAWVFTSRDLEKTSHEKMTKLKSRLKGCNKIEDKLYSEFADGEKFDRQLKKLEGKIQSIVEDTREGTTSPVYKDQDRYKLVLVCKKQPLGISKNDEGNVKYFLINRKSTQKTQKFLNDLKQKAYVEIVDPQLK